MNNAPTSECRFDIRPAPAAGFEVIVYPGEHDHVNIAAAPCSALVLATGLSQAVALALCNKLERTLAQATRE
jgi:hypothetical protein